MMTEIADVERPVLEWARANGFLAWKLTLKGNNGWPDTLYLLHYPTVAFIEFKAPRKKPRLLQQLRHAELLARGYPCAVFDNPKEAIEWLQALLP